MAVGVPLKGNKVFTGVPMAIPVADGGKFGSHNQDFDDMSPPPYEEEDPADKDETTALRQRPVNVSLENAQDAEKCTGEEMVCLSGNKFHKLDCRYAKSGPGARIVPKEMAVGVLQCTPCKVCKP